MLNRPLVLKFIASVIFAITSGFYNYFLNKFENGEWIHEFSGKEIFREIRGFLFNENYTNPENMDIDLAMAVGEWQYVNDRVPAELRVLKDTLKRRVKI